MAAMTHCLPFAEIVHETNYEDVKVIWQVQECEQNPERFCLSTVLRPLAPSLPDLLNVGVLARPH